MLPQSEWTVDRFRKAKYAIAGTVDQVKREIEELKTLGGEGDLEWLGWFFDQGFMPWDEEMRQIELFAEHIIPTFRRAGRSRRPRDVLRVEPHLQLSA
jgi:hypothetical protein